MAQWDSRVTNVLILCDAGGGTAEVVGYRVKQVTPTLELVNDYTNKY